MYQKILGYHSYVYTLLPFAQDLKCMPREIANTLLHIFATFPYYVFQFRFVLSLDRIIFYTRHHLILVLINRQLLKVFEKKRWRNVNVVEHQLQIVWVDVCFTLYYPFILAQSLQGYMKSLF